VRGTRPRSRSKAPLTRPVRAAVKDLCRPSCYADVRRAAAGQAAGLVLKVGIFIGRRASRGCLVRVGMRRVRCQLAASGR
jgi:hypothetical protein